MVVGPQASGQPGAAGVTLFSVAASSANNPQNLPGVLRLRVDQDGTLELKRGNRTIHRQLVSGPTRARLLLSPRGAGKNLALAVALELSVPGGAVSPILHLPGEDIPRLDLLSSGCGSGAVLVAVAGNGTGVPVTAVTVKQGTCPNPSVLKEDGFAQLHGDYFGGWVEAGIGSPAIAEIQEEDAHYWELLVEGSKLSPDQAAFTNVSYSLARAHGVGEPPSWNAQSTGPFLGCGGDGCSGDSYMEPSILQRHPASDHLLIAYVHTSPERGTAIRIGRSSRQSYLSELEPMHQLTPAQAGCHSLRHPFLAPRRHRGTSDRGGFFLFFTCSLAEGNGSPSSSIMMEALDHQLQAQAPPEWGGPLRTVMDPSRVHPFGLEAIASPEVVTRRSRGLIEYRLWFQAVKEGAKVVGMARAFVNENPFQIDFEMYPHNPVLEMRDFRRCIGICSLAGLTVLLTGPRKENILMLTTIQEDFGEGRQLSQLNSFLQGWELP
jgi:hypothetical protein